MAAKNKSKSTKKAKAAAPGIGGKLSRASIAALSLAAVCESIPAQDSVPPTEPQSLTTAPGTNSTREVFVAKDALPTEIKPAASRTRGGDQFTLAKLSAFQKPALEEHLIEPEGAGSGSCSCNTVCSCVPVQTCACNTVCACHTVSTCAAYSSGGGGGGGGYGGYYVPCW